jgi:acetyl-CoA carboxylase biotin carboxyl carrier protein
MINLDELKVILDLVREHELSELEIEGEGFRIRVRKGGEPAVMQPPPAAFPVAALSSPAQPVLAKAAEGGPGPSVGVDTELAIVTSPIVGTFYRAPEPDAPPFAQPGDRVQKGQTLCIIEAMKMMNAIDSDYEGTLVKVYVENGQPVQYGERLFAIKRG